MAGVSSFVRKAVRLLRLIDWFIPAEAHADVRRFATTRVLVAVALTAVVLEPLMSLRHFLLAHNPVAGALTLSVGFLATGLLFAIRRGLALDHVIDALAAVVILLSALVSIARGGFYISTMIACAVVPMGVGLFGRARATLVWFGVSGLVLAAVALVTSTGVHGLRRETAIDVGPLLGALVLTTVMALFHERAQAMLEREKEELRQRVAAAERLEALGQLAAGVAHDFNNLLTVFRASGEMMVDGLPADHPLRPDAEAVRDAADRGSKIARQLLAFARPPVAGEERFELGATLLELEPLLRKALPRRIALELTRPARTFWIAGDAQSLLHVLLNLVVNARDAMAESGTITIVAEEQPGERVAIDVIDTGTGIPPEVLSRIFDPFFTTKERGRGSGLGLASAHGFVRGMRGELTVAKTELGRGTTFRVLLPIARATGSVRPPMRAEGGTRSDRPLVLVVDDQPELATATGRLLGAKFNTVCATSGAAALAELRQHRGVAAVVTDVCMPEMDGLALAAEVRRVAPGTRIVYMTGYADERMMEDEVQAGSAVLVRKPFDRAELVAAIERALDVA
jgi:signal transduction histidine kinase